MISGALWAVTSAALINVFAGLASAATPVPMEGPRGSRSLLEVSARSRRFRTRTPSFLGSSGSSYTGSLLVPTKPPQLDPWEDVQPIDTQIGNYFTSNRGEDDIDLAAPNMTAMDLEVGCPLLLSWPTDVDVVAPDPCGGRGIWPWYTPPNGGWANGGNLSDKMVEYSTSCGFFTKEFAEVITYRLPGGDLFGTSQTATTLYGTRVLLRDCSGRTRFIIDEKVYRREGAVNADACNKYGSCDGTVFLQYFVRDQSERIIAETPYLNLFQDQFEVISPAGPPVAMVSRLGEWSPVSGECGEKTWTIKYNAGAGGIFLNAEQRWPIAEMVSIMTHRDQFRRSSGLMRPSACEVSKVVVYFLLVLIAIFLFFFGGFFFQQVIRTRLQIFLLRLELWFCPKRMNKASNHDWH